MIVQLILHKFTGLLKKAVWAGSLAGFVLLQALPVSGQHGNYRFEKLPRDLRLNHSTINCFLQDHKGYFWFGTWGGLGRYDGYKLQVFFNEPSKKQSLTADQITALIEDQKKRIWIGTLNSGFFRYDQQTETFVNFRALPGNKNSLSDNDVWSLFSDSKGFIWIGTKNGLNRFDPETNNFVRIYSPPKDGPGPTADYIYSICETAEGSIWSASTRGLLRIRFGNAKEFEVERFFLHEPGNPADSTLGNFIYKVEPAKSAINTLWVGTKAGLKRIRYPGSGKDPLEIERFRVNPADPNSLSSNIVTDFWEEQDGKLWVATYNGLNLMDPSKKSFHRFFYDPDDPHSISNNKINRLLKDRSGILWIGTHKGINKLNLYRKPFVNVSMPGSSQLSSNLVTYLCRGQQKYQIWIASQGGLSLLDYDGIQTGIRQYWLRPERLADFANYTTSILRDPQGRIWVATQGAGVMSFRESDIPPRGGTILPSGQFTRGMLNDDYVMEMFAYQETFILLGLWDGGIDLIDKKSGAVAHFLKAGSLDLAAFPNVAFAQTTEKSGRQSLWVGTRGNGLLKMHLDAAGRKLLLEAHFKYEPERQGLLNSNKINALYVDCQNQLWVATGSGLNMLEPGSRQFHTFTTAHGLPDDAIQAIIQDRQGNIWVSTQQGIAKLHREGQKWKISAYDMLDGLQNNFFNNNCVLNLPNGILAFGGVEGLSLFQPEDIRIDSTPPQAIISDFQLFNKSVEVGDLHNGRFILTKHISETKEISLTHKENVLSFEFAGLHFAEPRKNRFAYKLEGFDENWTYTSAEKRYVHYTNLPYRTFTFMVKAANGDGMWSEPVELRIRVNPPFWLTGWAFLIYSLLFAGMLYGFWWIGHLRAAFRNRLMLEKLEREKLEEVTRVKLQFFTNISHELRTPLTLIISPLEQLIRQFKTDRPLTQTLGLMHRNAGKLLTIINQLLDFRKSEAGLMNIQAEKTNLVFFLQEIVYSFKAFSMDHRIQLDFTAECEEINAWIDRDQMEKVMFNLLSNALKFTPDGGRVGIFLMENLDEGLILVKVTDNGIGIAEDQKDRIFDPFHQGEKKPEQEYFGGTGIGLALAKSIMEKHGGKIRVESQVGQGSSFFLSIPMGTDHFSPQELDKRFTDKESFQEVPALAASVADPFGDESGEKKPDQKTKPHILIVEDTADIRLYLRENLIEDFDVTEAENGAEALSKARETSPDLIISDVVMPRMDGIEFCRRIKSDILTSHIPVILLTARTSLIYRIDGLEKGADDYMVKPFNLTLLKARVRNLILIREQLKEKFSRSIELSPSEVAVTQLDEAFLKHLLEIVEQHMGEDEFSIDDLARLTAMSRMQLYRKIKALTGQTPNTVIRDIRLKRAAQLLRTGQFNISQVAYRVGFSDLKYFRERFKEKFGVMPSEYNSK